MKKPQRKRDNTVIQRVNQSLDLPDYAACERLRAALHESGHLIAAKLLGESVTGIGLGGPDSLDGAAAWSRMRSRDVYSLRNRLVVLWSGPLSDGRPVPEIGKGELADDESAMFSIARELCGAAGSEKRIAGEIRRARIKAERLVKKHHAEIEQLAQALVHDYEVIDGIKPE
jgi:hypothetical protein